MGVSPRERIELRQRIAKEADKQTDGEDGPWGG
jgi:hypothetical protein